MTRVTNIMIFLLIFICGVTALQIFLSKRRSKLYGLILPGITFLFSVLGVLSVSFYTELKSVSQTVNENGEVIEKVVTEATQTGDLPSAIITALSVFLLYNIPTAILLAIYFACREKTKNKKEIDNMNIQDL